MQLTAFTDYALRTLMGLGVVAPRKLTVGELSGAYGISAHHLLKVVSELAALGYVETIRGKAGGARLARPPREICIGAVVRQMEPDFGVVPCLRSGDARLRSGDARLRSGDARLRSGDARLPSGDAPCVIAPACQLKRVLAAATEGFLSELDRHTLADLLEPRAKLQRLLQLV